MLTITVGKNGNAAFEAFGRLGESGIVAIAVEDQVKIIGAVVPGFYVPAFCGFAPFGDVYKRQILKSGCKIEKNQAREYGRLSFLTLLYSVIAMQILNLTYLDRKSTRLNSSH